MATPKSNRKRPLSDRKLRELVFDRLADSDMEAKKAIEAMQMYLEWLKTGRIPGKPFVQVYENSDKEANSA